LFYPNLAFVSRFIAGLAQRSDVIPALVPGAEVQCVFGKGIVKKRRADGVFEVSLTSWTLANGRSPVGFLQEEALTVPRQPPFAAGDAVETAFGEAVVTKARWDGVYECKPKAWALANNCSPVLYLQPSAMKPLKKTQIEVSVQDYIDRANASKAEGNELFKEKKYEEAALSYLRALNLMRFVPEELKNSEKAQIIELSVPTHNNLASCYVRMRQPVEAMTNATNVRDWCLCLACVACLYVCMHVCTQRRLPQRHSSQFDALCSAALVAISI
jgi:hypothetical protein